MTTCPVIAARNDANIELSTYDRTVGTYVVISCKGFGRQVRDPTNVECLPSGAWTATPNLECYTKLNERETIIVGVSVACAILAIIVIIGICVYCCCFRDKNRWKRHRWWRRYDDQDYRTTKRYGYDYSPRGSVRKDFYYTKERDNLSYNGSFRRDYDYRKSRIPSYDYDIKKSRRFSYDEPIQYRRTRRYSDGDRYSLDRRVLRNTRRYSFEDAPPIEFTRRRRYSDPSVYTSVYRRPERVIYREPIHVSALPVRGYVQEYEPPPVYTEEPVVVRYDEQPILHHVQPRIVRRYTRRYVTPQYLDSPPVYSSGLYSDNIGFGSRNSIRTDPYIDGGSSYYGGNITTTKIVPAANIVELDDVKEEPLAPMRTGHYEITTMKESKGPKSSTNYFFGRQDYPYEERKQALSHVLYHGNGKTTKIFEDETDGTIY